MKAMDRYEAAVLAGATAAEWRDIAAALETEADAVYLEERCMVCDNCRIYGVCGARDARADQLADRATDCRARAERLAEAMAQGSVGS